MLFIVHRPPLAQNAQELLLSSRGIPQVMRDMARQRVTQMALFPPNMFLGSPSSIGARVDKEVLLRGLMASNLMA